MCIHLKVWEIERKRDRQRERERLNEWMDGWMKRRSFICWLTPPCVYNSKSCTGRSQEPGTMSLPQKWQESKYLSCYLLVYWAYISRNQDQKHCSYSIPSTILWDAAVIIIKPNTPPLVRVYWHTYVNIYPVTNSQLAKSKMMCIVTLPKQFCKSNILLELYYSAHFTVSSLMSLSDLKVYSF